MTSRASRTLWTRQIMSALAAGLLLAASPGCTDGRAGRAEAWIARAETALGQAIESGQPRSFDINARVWIAALLGEAGLVDRAREAARKITVRAARAESLIAIAVAQARAGDRAGAMATLELARAEVDGSRDESARRALGKRIAGAQALAGDTAAARLTVEQLGIEGAAEGIVDGELNQVRFLTALDLAIAGRPDEAKAMAGQITSEGFRENALAMAATLGGLPDSPDAQVDPAQADPRVPEPIARLIESGDQAGARAAIDKLAANGAEGEVHVAIARMQEEHGDLGGAVETCKRAVAAGANIFGKFPADFVHVPDGPGVFAILLEGGEYELAIDGARRVVDGILRWTTLQYVAAELVRRGREDLVEQRLGSVDRSGDAAESCFLALGAAAGHLGASNVPRAWVYGDLVAEE